MGQNRKIKINDVFIGNKSSFNIPTNTTLHISPKLMFGRLLEVYECKYPLIDTIFKALIK